MIEAKDQDRQYHMDAINRLASFLAFHGTSFEVVQSAVDNISRMKDELDVVRGDRDYWITKYQSVINGEKVMSDEKVYTDNQQYRAAMKQFIHGGQHPAQNIGLNAHPYNTPGGQQNTLGKRSALDEVMDITAKEIDELCIKLSMLTEKLTPICLPMVADIPHVDEQKQSSQVVNRMFVHYKLIEKMNQDVNNILNSLEL